MKQYYRAGMRNLVIILMMVVVGLTGCTSKKSDSEEATTLSDDWKKEFKLADRILENEGENSYFILKPGFQLVLEGEDERVIITVLDETRQIGDITTRVVEEREEENGQVVEISRNFCAICKGTGDVFYFGEDVEMYEEEELTSSAGEWRADVEGCKPGMLMPGKPESGMKYYQEYAPEVAMDRAEIVSLSDTLETPAGTFVNCLKTQETSTLDSDEKEYKTYAPGIGLIQDEDLLLVSYGYISGE
jgi:hypothetical protein